jgi:uncharacterized protein YcsI (UPF0317 family)
MNTSQSTGAVMSAREARTQMREGRWTTTTSGIVPGVAQANLVVLPRDLAYDFLLFCMRNPQPCPVLDVTDSGSPVPVIAAPDADLRTDLPRYRVYRHGELVDEPLSIESYWSDDLVGFLLGCSFTFEHVMLESGMTLRHLECGCTVPMYKTSIACRPAGVFHGPMVVSMRPIAGGEVARAVQISSRFPAVHGAPVHIGVPEAIGIADLDRPDWGDPVPVHDDEVPVFWACGVTPQAVAMAARPPLMITHSPGHMFITDIPIPSLAAL